jgi:hypothetical protein
MAEKVDRLRIFKNGVDRLFPTDTEGSSLCYRACDLKVRWFLNLRAEREYSDGNLEGAQVLIGAMLYLTDRLAYEVDKPGARAAFLRAGTTEARND